MALLCAVSYILQQSDGVGLTPLTHVSGRPEPTRRRHVCILHFFIYFLDLHHFLLLMLIRSWALRATGRRAPWGHDQRADSMTAAVDAVPPEIRDEVPVATALDEFTRARTRVLLVSYFGEFATLDAHLDLLDMRGAWYAERALGSWSPRLPEAFFGVIRHVVRTQMDGPAPSPDVEGWAAAGRPAAEPRLAQIWDQITTLPGFALPAGTSDRDEGTHPLDQVLLGWPEAGFDGSFLLPYVKLELTLSRRAIALPPIGT